MPVQRCTVHKHRNLLAHAPKKLHDEVSADYTDMIYAKTAEEIEAKRKAFLRKWRLRCARSPTAWKKRASDSSPSRASRRPMESHPNYQRHRAVARGVQAAHQDPIHAALAETACMLFWALLACGQITLRKVDGWKTLAAKPIDQPIDLAA